MSERTIRRSLVESPHGYIESRELGPTEVEAGGPAEREPLLLVHSTPGAAASYDAFLPLLAGRRRVVALSSHGYGSSDRPPEPYTTLEQYGRALAWGLDGLGIERASVFGTQTGALLTIEFAVAYPQRTARLVLEEPFHWGTPERREALLRIHSYEPARADGSHLLALWRRTHAHHERQRAQRRRVGSALADADLEPVGESILQTLRVNSAAGAEIYGGAGWLGAAPYAMGYYDTWARVAEIRAPTLVIHGTMSQLGRSHERFVEAIPDARGLRLPSDGNFLPNQAPELFAAELLAFLDEGAAVEG
ncbi:MAG: alpha/beta hydrolase [Chloroflexi bacterium]|nr:alpha/beta hydrolase [Chloroflexota bacterium]